MTEEEGELGEDRDLLAAEYVLGVLDADAMQRARMLLVREAEFAALVDAWESRLAPLSDDFQPVVPPMRAKAALEARLFEQEAEPTRGLWNKLSFWRSLAIISSSLFVVTIGIALWTGTYLFNPPGNLVVSLQPANSSVSFVALYQPGSETVKLSPVSGHAGTDKDFELWLIEPSQAPVSLGVLPRSGNASIAVPPALARKLAAGVTLAISLEPAGGSPTGAPTGPVVAAGEAKSI